MDTTIEPIPTTTTGQVDLNHLHKLVEEAHLGKAPPIGMIIVTHIPTSSGIVQDAVGIGKITNEFKIPYILDACQSVGQLVVDVQAIQCDFLSATGRKYLR